MKRIVCSLVLVALVGCGSPENFVSVSGTVIKDGKPLILAAKGLPPGDPGFRLAFIAMNGNDVFGDTSYAIYSATDGTFQVKGPKEKGLVPGKYRISIQKGAMFTPDEFGNAYAADKTPLTVTIPAGSSVKVRIDLDKKTATLE